MIVKLGPYVFVCQGMLYTTCSSNGVINLWSNFIFNNKIFLNNDDLVCWGVVLAPLSMSYCDHSFFIILSCNIMLLKTSAKLQNLIHETGGMCNRSKQSKLFPDLQKLSYAYKNDFVRNSHTNIDSDFKIWTNNIDLH